MFGVWSFEIEREREKAPWILLHTWLRFRKISSPTSIYNSKLNPPQPLLSLPFLSARQLSKLLRSSFHVRYLHLHVNDRFFFFCRSSSEKYAPLDWSVYFDKEDDVAIPESNDVSLQNQNCHCFFTRLDINLPLTIIFPSIYLGFSCLHGRNWGSRCILFTRWWLFWVRLVLMDLLIFSL